ncbi:MAG: RNA-dependent RNA polymerase [Tomato alphanucleorhabdovirus 1]|uniref:RNA-directed RNA polymerase n=1 Tax=Tomato alphanucleorhabdovirus 1 TaxID=2950883 RepID=A0AAE9SK41_9RHAB|nr:MAG: RNA-dependent RNA polymerase [Tomato alphanucleorhabdovirus 1]
MDETDWEDRQENWYDARDDGDWAACSDDIHEGGDYHLQSALKSIDDYRSSHIFVKEEAKMVSLIGDMGVMLNNISCLQFLWAIASLNTPLNQNCIIRDLQRMDLMSIDAQKIGTLVEAECDVLYNGRLFQDISIKTHVTNCLQAHSLTNPCMSDIVRILCFLLMMKNNLKTIRSKGILGYSGLDHLHIVQDHIQVMVEPGFTITMNTDLVHIQIGSRRLWTPMPYFICAADKIQERYNLLLYSSVMQPLLTDICPSSDLIKQVFHIYDQLLADIGNDGYSDVSGFEALIVGIIISRDDDDLKLNGDAFLHEVLRDVSPRGGVYVRQMYELLRNVDVDQLADIHGLYRIWGHPIIDIDGGMDKMRAVSLQEKETDLALGDEVGRKFLELFFSNFRKKHGVYPLHHTERPDHVEISKAESSLYLLNCLRGNIMYNTANIGYKLEDWEWVVLDQNFEIPSSWNIIHTVKDKAISPNREELYHNLITRGHVFNQDMRRVILKTIMTPLGPMREFLERVGKYGLEKKYLMIGIYPKERELKIKPRFFSLMTHEFRLYVTSTEGLLNDKVLKYFPEITMSINLLEMTKIMSKLSGNQSDQSRSVTYVVNMDFMKWNQQMRYEICHPVFSKLGRAFGSPGLYDQTHLMLKECVIYLSSGERQLIADPNTGVVVDGINSWTGDGSGKEGLRQKGWTIMTVCDIKYVADRLGMDASLVGGGDNQVLTVTIRTSDVLEGGEISPEGKRKIRNKMKAFLTELQSHFDKRGLPLKASETWTSTSLFMYNKHMYYKGRPLRTVMKQISRCFPFSNSSVMSTALMCNSVSTILKAAMQKEHFIVGVITMKCLWGLYIAELARSMNPLFYATEGSLLSGNFDVVRQGSKRRLSIDEMDLVHFWAKILYLPSIFGGPGLSNCFNLTERGFPDPVTEGVMFLNKMHERLMKIDISLGIAVGSLKGISFSQHPNYEKLVEDPASISHDSPSHSTSTLRENAREAVLTVARHNNPDFVNLVSVANKENERNFYTALCSGSKLDPKVLHEIAKASLYGVTNSLISRIDKTRTIRRMNETMAVVSELAESEQKYIGYLHVRDKLPHDLQFSGCSRVTADSMRSLSYKKQVLGVTVPHPAEYLNVVQRNGHLCMSGYITIQDGRQDGNLILSSKGPCKPYFGSYTKERFKATDIASAYGDEDVLKRSVSIQKLIGWRYPADSTFGKIIAATLQAVSNVDPESVWVREETIRGSYDHRRNTDANTHGGIPNFLNTASTHLSMCTSTWVEHSRSGKNEYIHFQSCMITCVRYMLRYMLGPRFTDAITEYHAHECCSTCITEIEPIPPDSTSPTLQVSFPTLPNNILVYVESENVKMDYTRKLAIEDSQSIAPMILEDITVLGSSRDRIIDCISTILIIETLGRKHGMSKSFMILAREKVDVDACLLLFRKKLTILRYVDPTISVQSCRSLDVFCDTLQGMADKMSALGWATEGKLEGVSTSVITDTWENDKPIGMLCYPNSVLGWLPLQIVLHKLGKNPMLVGCPDCLDILKKVMNMRTRDALRTSMCSAHQFISVRVPIMCAHPDNLLKELTQIGDPNIPDMYHYEDVPDLSVIQTSHESELLDLPSLLPIFFVGEETSVREWADLIQRFLHKVEVDSIVMDLEIESAEVIYSAVKTRAGFLKPIHIMIDSLSEEETGNIFEKFRDNKLGQCPVIMSYSEDDITDGVSLVLSQKNDIMVEMLESRGRVFAVLGGSRLSNLDDDLKRKISHVYTFPRVIVPALLMVVEFDVHNYLTNLSPLHHLYEEVTHIGPEIPTPTRTSDNFTHASSARQQLQIYTFKNRLEMINVFSKRLREIDRIDSFCRRRKKIKRIQDILLRLIASVLAHAEPYDSDTIGRIKSADLDSIKGTIVPRLRQCSVDNALVRFYKMMYLRVRRDPLLQNIGARWDDIMISINFKTQKRKGFNIVGS